MCLRDQRDVISSHPRRRIRGTIEAKSLIAKGYSHEPAFRAGVRVLLRHLMRGRGVREKERSDQCCG
jgi:hypothetical protein